MPTLSKPFIKPARRFSNELLDRYRQQGDPPADNVITAVVEASGMAGLRSLMAWLANPTDSSIKDQHSAVQVFFRDYAQLPNWADPERMQRAMAFFSRHQNQINFTLGLFALPYTYLGAKGVQVLWLTERIKNDTARRLQETGEWVFAVNTPNEWPFHTSSSDHIVDAIGRTLKVRLIHAGARWFSVHSGRWNDDWGYPVNQEDMAATNLAFSYIVLLGLRKLGVSATDQEEEDFLHHINVVGYLNGVDEVLLAQNMREAYLLTHSIDQRQSASSEAGIGLTRALLNAITSQIIQQSANPTTARPETVRNLAAGAMRYFLGDHRANWLGLPNASVEKRLTALINRLPIFTVGRP
jgi:hypothetical protein